jgi:hypothetical protein
MRLSVPFLGPRDHFQRCYDEKKAQKRHDGGSAGWSPIHHGGVVGGCIRDPRTKTPYASCFFWGQASSIEQLDPSNLIIFDAYMV